MAGVGAVHAEALRVSRGDAASGVGEEEDGALTNDEGIADVLDAHRLALGQGEPLVLGLVRGRRCGNSRLLC